MGNLSWFRRLSFLSTAYLLLMKAIVTASPLNARCDFPAALAKDFPDPSIVLDTDSQTYYAFATSSGGVRVQVSHSTQLQSGWSDPVEALSSTGQWAKPDGDVWAPHVQRMGGRWAMYYAAPQLDSRSGIRHCVGLAWADQPQGPYKPNAQAFKCAASQGGVIDPFVLTDTSGSVTRTYVAYKIDGNNLGRGNPKGGDCKNEPQWGRVYDTPLMIQEVDAATGLPGRGMAGATTMLQRAADDGPLIEAPWLVQVTGGYVLLYSSGCYLRSDYMIKWAFRAGSDPLGAFTPGGRVLVDRSLFDQAGGGSVGATFLPVSIPGSPAVAPSGVDFIFHAQCAQGRCMYHAGIDIRSTARSGGGHDVSVAIVAPSC